MSDLKQKFETWAVSHGSMLLEPAAEMTCENGWFPATYHSAMTEIAWRAFANLRTQPEATAPAQDLSAAILSMDCPDTSHYGVSKAVGYEQAWDECRRAAAALASSANALSAGDSQKPWWADEEVFKFAERYRALRKMYVNINPFVRERISGKLLDFRIDQRLLADSLDGKLPWERASSAKEDGNG